MITLKGLFKSSKKQEKAATYTELSDFLAHASDAKKGELLREAARRADEDQLAVFKRAQMKIETS